MDTCFNPFTMMWTPDEEPEKLENVVLRFAAFQEYINNDEHIKRVRQEHFDRLRFKPTALLVSRVSNNVLKRVTGQWCVDNLRGNVMFVPLSGAIYFEFEQDAILYKFTWES